MTLRTLIPILATLFWMGWGNSVWSQSTGKFTADYDDVPLDSALQDFRQQCGFSFSYDPDPIALKSVPSDCIINILIDKF